MANRPAYYDVELARAELDKEDLFIRYAYGRGSFGINLAALLPCSGKDFDALLSAVDLAEDPEAVARQIYDYIARVVAYYTGRRSEANEATQDGRQAIADYTRSIKRYTTHAAKLSKRYGLPEMVDTSHVCQMKKAAVYAFVCDHGTYKADRYKGWTFTKGGYVFDVYRRGKEYAYSVLLHNTGLSVGSCEKLNAAPAQITKDILNHLDSNPQQIADSVAKFNDFMKEAGYIREGENMTYTFTDHSIVINGEEFAAGYSITPRGAVVALVAGLDPIRIEQGSPQYNDALEAAQKARKTGGKATEEPAQVEEPETATEEPAEPRNVPEKTFAGQAITGRGWQILFDAETQRTRVIFDKIPPVKYREAVKAAGFFWSPRMKSWNKKLSWKAYRAAGRLAETLAELDKAA